MPSQAEIQENITVRIIDGLQSGMVPWKKPWRNDPNCGSPANVVSRRNYSGINPILLDLAVQANGFTSRFTTTNGVGQVSVTVGPRSSVETTCTSCVRIGFIWPSTCLGCRTSLSSLRTTCCLLTSRSN